MKYKQKIAAEVYILQCDTSVVILIVLCFVVELLCCMHPMYDFIVFSSILVTEWSPIGKLVLTLYDVFTVHVLVPGCQFNCFLPRLLELECLLDCDIS